MVGDSLNAPYLEGSCIFGVHPKFYQLIRYYWGRLVQHLNESDVEDKIVKKNLKDLKITTFTNKVHVLFQ